MKTLTDYSIVVVSILAFCGCAAVAVAQISAPDIAGPASAPSTSESSGVAVASAAQYTVGDIFSKP